MLSAFDVENFNPNICEIYKLNQYILLQIELIDSGQIPLSNQTF